MSVDGVTVTMHYAGAGGDGQGQELQWADDQRVVRVSDVNDGPLKLLMDAAIQEGEQRWMVRISVRTPLDSRDTRNLLESPPADLEEDNLAIEEALEYLEAYEGPVRIVGAIEYYNCM